MGRYAQALKRGTRASGYSVAPPLITSWIFEQPAGCGFTANATLLIALPPGVPRWTVRWQANGGTVNNNSTNAGTQPLNLFAPGTVLTGQVAFADSGGVPISEYTTVKTFTTC